jgi:hypothetical protein
MSDDELAGLPNGLSRAGGIFSRRRLLGTTTLAVAGAALAAGQQASAQQPQSVRIGEHNASASDPGPGERSAEGAQSEQLHAAADRSRIAADVLEFVLHDASPRPGRRLVAPGECARLPDLDRDRGREHAAHRRRHPRTALAQVGRMGPDAQRQLPTDRVELRRIDVCGRRDSGRPLVLPDRRATLAARTRTGRMRIPSGVRRRRILRGRPRSCPTG